jgi:hypothetical protein
MVAYTDGTQGERMEKWIAYQHNTQPYDGCGGVEFFGIFDSKEEAIERIVADRVIKFGTGIRLDLVSTLIEIEPVRYFTKEAK